MIAAVSEVLFGRDEACFPVLTLRPGRSSVLQGTQIELSIGVTLGISTMAGENHQDSIQSIVVMMSLIRGDYRLF